MHSTTSDPGLIPSAVEDIFKNFSNNLISNEELFDKPQILNPSSKNKITSNMNLKKKFAHCKFSADKTSCNNASSEAKYGIYGFVIEIYNDDVYDLLEFPPIDARDDIRQDCFCL